MEFAPNTASTCPVAFTGMTGHAFSTFISTLMAAQCALSSNDQYPVDYALHLKDGEEFDFIVVGAGSAGSILSSRLSENPDWKVLLVEAGDYPSLTTEVPKVFFAIAQTKEDWDYTIEPTETACLGLNNKRCNCPRGKVLGGSSSINGMIYIRGNRKDFDNWGAKGNEGWDYDSLLPYFQKFEDLQHVKDERMGKGGELKITKNANDHPFRDILIDAYKEIGYGEYTEENPQGYLDAYTTIYNGTRYSASKAFLPATKNRKNAYVVLNAQVSKVLTTSDLRATGVEMRINDRLITVKATKEVILSAGSVNSPQILMNSGIGPKEHLENVGVPVVQNLRVGENLQDHIFFTGLMMKIGPEALHQASFTQAMDSWYEYLMHRTGPLSRTGIENFLFFFDSKNNSIYPTLEMYYVVVPKGDPYGSLKVVQSILNYPPEVIKTQEENIKHSNCVFLIPGITYPKSVGKILLRSSDPFDKPKIFTNYLSDENGEDLQLLLEGVRFYQKLMKTKAFAPHNPEVMHLDLINCRGHVKDSDDYWKCAIRNMATTIYHLAGTCKMGPEDDPTAVVDSRLRVYGVKGLRVVDASIMPDMISCNINAATMMIGQKASDMIKEDWTKQRTEL